MEEVEVEVGGERGRVEEAEELELEEECDLPFLPLLLVCSGTGLAPSSSLAVSFWNSAAPASGASFGGRFFREGFKEEEED